MGSKNISGNSFSMDNGFNIMGSEVKVKCTERGEWPPLKEPFPDVSGAFSSMLPSLMGGLPSSSGQGSSGGALSLAALASMCAAGTIGVTPNPQGTGYQAFYMNTLPRVRSGAYPKNAKLSEDELKKLVSEFLNSYLGKSGAAGASWKDLMNDVRREAAILDFMKGLRTDLCALIYDPVNANTGNFIYEKEDLLIKGRIPLRFKRTYNRIDHREGCLGKGWRHNYEICLLLEKDRCIIVWEDGREEPYVQNEKGLFEPLFCVPGRLLHIGKEFHYETQEGAVYIFNAEGKLQKQEDRNGQGLQFVYDKFGRLGSVSNGLGSDLNYKYEGSSEKLLQVTDHAGRSICFIYELGRLKEVKNAEGRSYFYSYDADKNICRIRNPRGIYILDNAYDSQGRTTKQTLADGGNITYNYQDDSSRTLVTEQNNNKVAYVHDENYRNIKTVRADGEEAFCYGKKNLLISRTDKNGNITKFTYDENANITQIIYPDGSIHNMTYDAGNHLLTLSVNGALRLKNVWNEKGNLIKTEDALGRCREITYDDSGNPVKILQPDKSQITIEYDIRGNIARILGEAGNAASFEYDNCNRMIRAADGNGNNTRYSYDAGNHVTSVINAAGKRRTYEYTKSGYISKVTDFNGAVISQEYNNMEQVKSITLPDGGKIYMEYDLMHNITKRILPGGAQCLYEYDPLGRLIRTTLPTGGTLRYEYDPNGNRTSVTDQSGNKTKMEYDERDRVIAVTDPTGSKTEYEYDMDGNMLSVTNTKGQSVSFTYDEAGQKTSETDSSGNKLYYEYNALGRITCVTDAKRRQIIYEYNPGGILKRKVYPDGCFESYTYDNNQNLVCRRNHKGDYLEFQYDCLNHMTEAKSCFGLKRRYTYDAQGNITSVTDESGHVTKYEYSPEGRRSTVTDKSGNKTEYAYDSMGNLISVCRHKENVSLLTSYERNTLGKIVSITDPTGGQEHYIYDQAGRITIKRDKDGHETLLQYTPAGDVSQITYADGRIVNYSYNPLRQLTEVSDTPGTTAIEAVAEGARLPVFPFVLPKPPNYMEEIDGWMNQFMERSEQYKPRFQYDPGILTTDIYHTENIGLSVDREQKNYRIDAFGTELPIYLINNGEVMDPDITGNISFRYIGVPIGYHYLTESIIPEYSLFKCGWFGRIIK